MPKQLTADDVRVPLNAHVAAKGVEIRAKYGPNLGWSELELMLEDRTCVRYPCAIEFNAESLQPGEFAHPVAKGGNPEDGFTMFVHPFFMTRLPEVPFLVLYQLVAVNYGEFASGDDAVTFGAAALGLAEDAYYERLCELVDPISDCGCA